MRSIRRLSPLITTCALVGALLASSGARAAGVSPVEATAEQKRDATAHFIAGKKALDSGNLDEAISELSTSLDVVDSPNARLERARALRDADRLADSWLEYRRAEETATTLAVREDRYAKTAQAAAAERGELEKSLAFVAVTVTHPAPGATLTVAGRAVPARDWSAPIVVAPGPVEVIVGSAGGLEIARSTVAAATGRTTPVTLDARPPDPASSAVRAASPGPDPLEDETALPREASIPGPPPEAPPAPPRSSARPFAYVAGGVGVAGVATFAVFGLLANATYADLKNTCPRGCLPDRRGEIDRGVLQQTIANVALGIGLGGLAAGTTIFLFTMPPKSSMAAASLVIGAGYVGVRGVL